MRLTQADLARATGIRPNTINELYHELADRVNLEHLDLICEALDCELDELIVRVPNKESAITHRVCRYGIGDAALRLFAWAGSCKGGPECYGLAVRTDDRSDRISTYKLERIA